MTGTNYQKLIKVFGEEFAEFYSELGRIKSARYIMTARAKQLDNIGALFGYSRIGDESDADYRIGLLSVIGMAGAVGTRPVIKQFLANYLRINESEILLKEEEPNFLIVQLNTDFSDRATEIRQFVEKLTAAGVYMEVHFGGSYWDVDTWDNSDWR